MAKALTAGLLAIGLCTALQVQAADPLGDGWDDGDDALLVSGHLELGHSVRRAHDVPFGSTPTRSELLLRVEASRALGAAELAARVDLGLDRVTDEARLDIRHATIDLPLAQRSHLRIGRQVLSWGLGDLVFINDRFPKDYQRPLAGADDSYFKAPSNAVRLSAGFAPFDVDLAYTPVFAPDRYIDGRRLGFFDPDLGQRIGGDRLIEPARPARRPGNGEFALRLHRTHAGVEYALYGYRGFDKQPLGRDADGRPAFHRRDSAGASLRAPLGAAILSLEVGRDWPQVNAAEVGRRQPATRSWLLGVERELAPKLTAGVQLFESRLVGHDRSGPDHAQPRARQLVSLRLSRLALQDRLQLSLIQLHSPSQHDRWLRATASYRFSDRWLAGSTVNAFGGPLHSEFGQLEPDSNFGVWLRRQF
jgi:hypothetical protein